MAAPVTRLPFYADCVSWRHELLAALEYLIDEGVECSRSTWLRRCEPDPAFTGADGLTAPRYYGVAYFRLPGLPVYWFSHSCIEYVFAEPATIRRVHELALAALAAQDAA